MTITVPTTWEIWICTDCYFTLNDLPVDSPHREPLSMIEEGHRVTPGGLHDVGCPNVTEDGTWIG